MRCAGPWARACTLEPKKLATRAGSWARAFTLEPKKLGAIHAYTRAGPWARAYIHTRWAMGSRNTLLVWNVKGRCVNYPGGAKVVETTTFDIQPSLKKLLLKVKSRVFDYC